MDRLVTHLVSCAIFLKEEQLDRILYRGGHLDLIAYSRAELVGSDHRPGRSHCFRRHSCSDHAAVFAIFRAEIRVIDAAKRNSLHRLLLDGITCRGPDEKLDEKLASMALIGDAIDCEHIGLS